MIDLHTHSTASDGFYSPSDLISTAVGKGLKYIALTDHNTVRGLKEAYIAAKQYDIHLINGIELSCEHNTHIIGLFLKRLDEINSKDIIRNKYMEQSLNGYGYTKEEYGTLRGARDAFVKMIVEKGKAPDKTHAIEHFIQPPFGYGEAIDLIHRSGGLAILAHPNRIIGIDKNTLPEFVKELKSYDIDGIEVYQSTQTDDYTDFVMKLAIENNLLISGGSDYHSPTRAERELGLYGNIDNRKPIPMEIFDNLWQNRNKYK